ncbi:hypothetical protein D3C72_1357090 [compost metagenome]
MKSLSTGAIASLGMMPAMPLGMARCASSGAYTALSLISTVLAFLGVMLAISCPTALPRADTSIQRCSDATTSSAVMSLSLWNLTPLRRAMV